LGFLLY
jgi:hypothetical protein